MCRIPNRVETLLPDEYLKNCVTSSNQLIYVHEQMLKRFRHHLRLSYRPERLWPPFSGIHKVWSTSTTWRRAKRSQDSTMPNCRVETMLINKSSLFQNFRLSFVGQVLIGLPSYQLHFTQTSHISAASLLWYQTQYRARGRPFCHQDTDCQ